MALISNKRN